MADNIDDVLMEADFDMQAAIEHLESRLRTIRAGKASPSMLSGVRVDYYGSMTKLDQVANVSVQDAQMLVVKPWEKTMIQPIEKAILEANLGLNPIGDAELVRVPVPRLTEERRKQLVKQAKEEIENAKISIRQARSKYNSELKKLGADKSNSISEDDVKSAEGKVQDLTNKYGKQVEDIFKKKEDDIMTV